MKQSEFLSLGIRDILRGLVVAVLTPVVTILADSAERGEWNFNWRLIALSAIGGGCAYLLKNLFTPSEPQSIGGGGIQNPPKP
jgi:hypothetical protein